MFKISLWSTFSQLPYSPHWIRFAFDKWPAVISQLIFSFSFFSPVLGIFYIPIISLKCHFHLITSLIKDYNNSLLSTALIIFVLLISLKITHNLAILGVSNTNFYLIQYIFYPMFCQLSLDIPTVTYFFRNTFDGIVNTTVAN